MRDSRLFKSSCIAVIASFAGLAGIQRASAALLAESDSYSSTSQQAFDGNISSTDLIENGSSALAGAPTTTGSVAGYAGTGSQPNSWSNLTDGQASSKGAGSSNTGDNDLSHDTYFDTGSFGTNPSITYTFSSAGAPSGYTITSINSISGWQDTHTFSNQAYQIDVQYAGSSSFVPLQTVNYSPFPDNGGNVDAPNSSQVTLTGSVPNVTAIRFDILNNGGSGQVFREIDVAGTPTSVPEPASIASLLVGSGMLLLRRRH